MTEKQLFYPLLSVYFSLILGDLQKEKLQIVSIFRFGHKKRGLFQCPPLGRAGEGLPSYNLSHTRRKPQQVAMSGRHWLRVITPLSESELLWFPPRMTFQSPVCGPLGLV